MGHYLTQHVPFLATLRGSTPSLKTGIDCSDLAPTRVTGLGAQGFLMQRDPLECSFLILSTADWPGFCWGF